MYTGTARSIEEKNKHLIVEKNNIRVGILSYTYGTNGMEAAVSQEKLKYMVNYYNDYNQVVNDINSIKAESVDLLIAYMHWGYEYHRTLTMNRKILQSCWQRKALILSSEVIPMLSSQWK